MGCAFSSGSLFPNKYKTIAEIRDAMRAANMENSDMIVAIDVTRSNEAAIGAHTSFEGRDLHDLSVLNPYQRVMRLVGGEVAASLDKDGTFPVLAFGDAASVDHPSGCVFVGDAKGFDEVDRLYRGFLSDPRVVKSGPTSFEGVVRFAIDQAIRTRRFHTLLIITDGQINDEKEVSDPSAPGKWRRTEPTIEALIEASQYPIEVIIVGVGDGPWDAMEALDDELKAKAKAKKMTYRVDCCQFVPFTRYMRTTDTAALQAFTVDCLQEVPQLKAWLDEHGMMGPGARTTPSGLELVKWTPVAVAPPM
ncbi:hypothetical protein FNF27_07975 [Cafeteria roenbergensis]|uniref:Copine C-terminal domain-containing protein n=1 Tax=Cafeteria roenbergensis TaxID=33653 RepID=A0A5A8DDW2_CAFRO|nr:hypothetical protein FNF29_05608 [Cafeteria roenbergensis]KAA0150513.1 hypothetical protein FNF31_06995 [Cafeteria roenbergensis]KAA0163199.1 hypothetical protein FNF27_07975 [Cafeteria roenbergensis]|eukprot:KAA0149988.1 hypothetical protein FNF29_05608 [Cafeteria roenbergensis]